VITDRDASTRATELDELLSEREIRAVCLRYCRGIDRRQFELVRECYHPDATDEHGDFVGSVDEFIEHCRAELVRFESTMHFVGNVLVEVHPGGESARAETYAMAMHRVPPRHGKPPRDHVVGLRYVDDFSRRNGGWRIANRICVFEWTRTDPVIAGWTFTEAFRRGRTDGSDVVFAPSLAAEIAAGRTGAP
jgi:hypothetical protein